MGQRTKGAGSALIRSERVKSENGWVDKKLTNKTNERAANGENRLVWNESNDYDDQKTGKAPLLLEWPRSVKKKLGSRAK